MSMEGLELVDSRSRIILTEYYSHVDVKPRSSRSGWVDYSCSFPTGCQEAPLGGTVEVGAECRTQTGLGCTFRSSLQFALVNWKFCRSNAENFQDHPGFLPLNCRGRPQAVSCVLSQPGRSSASQSLLFSLSRCRHAAIQYLELRDTAQSCPRHGAVDVRTGAFGSSWTVPENAVSH